MLDNLLHVVRLEAAGEFLNDVFWVISQRGQPSVLEDLRHRPDLCGQALRYALIDGGPRFKDLDASHGLWRDAESVDAIDRLQEVRRIERSIQVERVVTRLVKADGLAAGGRIRDHHSAVAILMEAADSSLPGVLII
jgi:hypothetical protein